jgi:hypothetical protein
VSSSSAADHLIATKKSQGSSGGSGGFRGTHYEFVKHQVESEFGRKTGADVLLEDTGQVERRIVRAELGPRHRLREHRLFRQPAAIRGNAGLVASFPRNEGEVNRKDKIRQSGRFCNFTRV